MTQFGFRLCTAIVAAVSIWIAPAALGQTKPAAIRIVTLPVVTNAPLIVARDKGYFTEENLNVSWTIVAQGAVAVEAVFGGSAEIGNSSVFEPMVARGNGLDMAFVAAGARIRSTQPDNSALIVRADDTIKSAKDFVGKKVSAGLLNSVNHVHMMEWLQKAGVAPASVQFLEIPFPQMSDALLQNRLDAVWSVEPFFTLTMKGGKVRVIAYPYQENIPRMDITAYFAKESWLKANADAARRFKRAIDKASNLLINASKDERDGWITKWSGMKPEVVASMNLPEYVTEFNVPSLRANIELAVKHKLLAKSFDVNMMVWKH